MKRKTEKETIDGPLSGAPLDLDRIIRRANELAERRNPTFKRITRRSADYHYYEWAIPIVRDAMVAGRTARQVEADNNLIPRDNVEDMMQAIGEADEVWL